MTSRLTVFCCHYTFSAVVTYMEGGGMSALVSWLFCDFILCLWCNVGSAIGIESINHSIFDSIFFLKSVFHMISVKIHCV